LIKKKKVRQEKLNVEKRVHGACKVPKNEREKTDIKNEGRAKTAKKGLGNRGKVQQKKKRKTRGKRSKKKKKGKKKGRLTKDPTASKQKNNRKSVERNSKKSHEQNSPNKRKNRWGGGAKKKYSAVKNRKAFPTTSQTSYRRGVWKGKPNLNKGPREGKRYQNVITKEGTFGPCQKRNGKKKEKSEKIQSMGGKNNKKKGIITDSLVKKKT